jgi:hypothetical protein
MFDWSYVRLIIKVGGLDSRDQSRSRTSYVSRRTFLNCRDFLDGRDQLFFFSVEIFKIEIFQSRLWRVEIFVEIVETRRDCQDLSRHVEIFEICRDAVEICRDAVEICREISTLSRPKVSTDWEISTRKYKNPRTSRSRSRQTVEKRRKFQISTNFSISIETFWSGHCCRDEIEISRSRSRYLDCRD